MTTARELFDRLAAEHLGRPGVTLGRIWHNEGLKVNDKIYAMLVRDRLVVKLPAARAAELAGSGRGVPFEPSPGRRMKEWVAVDPPSDPAEWRQLMADAGRYVGGLNA